MSIKSVTSILQGPNKAEIRTSYVLYETLDVQLFSVVRECFYLFGVMPGDGSEDKFRITGKYASGQNEKVGIVGVSRCHTCSSSSTYKNRGRITPLTTGPGPDD